MFDYFRNCSRNASAVPYRRSSRTTRMEQQETENTVIAETKQPNYNDGVARLVERRTRDSATPVTRVRPPLGAQEKIMSVSK